MLRLQEQPKRASLRGASYVGYSQKYGLLLVIDYITAPNIWGYPNRALHISGLQEREGGPFKGGPRISVYIPYKGDGLYRGV